jgi:hypothetical protein
MDWAAVDWASDVSAADWILDRLHPFAVDVGSLIPEGFEAYARILHPAWDIEGGQRVKVRWVDVAREAGAGLHPTTQFEALRSNLAEYHIEHPLAGTLARDELDALVEILTAHTSRPQSCWFGIWEGYGWLQGGPAVAELAHRPRAPLRIGRPRRWLRIGRPRRWFWTRAPEPAAPAAPRLQIPGRSFVLYRGPLKAATAFYQHPALQSPNLWWPEDRAWCVASEIDLHSTYLGGTQALIDQVLHDGRLEALPASLTDRISS